MHKSKKTFSYPASDVFMISCKAQRINKYYMSASQQIFFPEKKTNKTIMLELLEKGNTNLTAKDREEGVKIRQHFQALTFKVLANQYLSTFDRSAMEIANKDVISKHHDLAIIASLPHVYKRSRMRKAEDVMMEEAASLKTIGAIKDRLDLVVTILKSVWSTKWECRFTTGTTDQKEMVSFASASFCPKVSTVVNIRGTVKRHLSNGNGMVTQLNRVKLI